MNIRFTSALLALALPVLAQGDAVTAPENLFYKAFYLEKGTRDFVGAMALYEQFLAVAPTHKLASEAAKQILRCSTRRARTRSVTRSA